MDSPVLVGAGSLSPTSPVSVRSLAGVVASKNGIKRKRSSVSGLITSFDSSPGSVVDDQDALDHAEKRRHPGVKRACNECRQQKLRCDVVQEPFQGCSRCIRLKLDCKIESNFKRVGKRSKHAEMEREIEKLRRAVQIAKSQGFAVPEDEDDMGSQLASPVVNNGFSHTRNPSLIGSEEAVSSLLNLKRGGSYHMPRIVRELEDFKLSGDDEGPLFKVFFTHYHPSLPFLNPSQTPDQYYQQHPLLYWTIVSVACRRYPPPGAQPGEENRILSQLSRPLHNLLWRTVGEVPQTYFVVKALCLLCTWPVPTSHTSMDPTHILCGVMMKTATGIGLHRPSHTNDFSRVTVELNKEQLHDRVTTWAVCNIVAQTIGTGYGQPASSLYDWTLAIRPGEAGPFTLGPELEARLQIERFCDKVSKEMYSNASDSRGVTGDEHRAMLMRIYRREFSELQAAILSQNVSPIVKLHLRAANLHLRLAGFFDASTTPGYIDDLMNLWRATVSFLDYILDGDEGGHSPTQIRAIDNPLCRYATNYIHQMLVAAGFALLKLMRSFFAQWVDVQSGRDRFHRTIDAIRSTSVLPNDLNFRLAEIMVQIWNGSRHETFLDADGEKPALDDSLQLKVRCRHSMSLVFDSIWHWREEYQARGKGTIDSLNPPTKIESANESSSASSTHMDATLMPPSHGLPLTGLGPSSNGGLTPGGSSHAGGGNVSNSMLAMNYDTGYDMWDSNHWMLDGLLDFNFIGQPQMGETTS